VDVSLQTLEGKQKIEQIEAAMEGSITGDNDLKDKSLGSRHVKVEPNVFPSRVM
jgi:hypothetical protein